MPAMKKIVAACILLASTTAAIHAQAQTQAQAPQQQAFPATLTGHAVLPAQSFVAAPKDGVSSFSVQ